MKKPFILLAVSLFISCSTIKVVQDEFDNSALAKLELKDENSADFARLDGKIKIVNILFTKDYASKKFADINLFCKFEGYRGELLDGNAIELSTEGTIHKLSLVEARLGQNETETGTSLTIFTRIGPFTYSDSTRSNINIIAMDLTFSKEIQEAILGSKTVMLRIYTKNIDGVSKNTFRCRSRTVRKIKDLVELTPTK